MAQGKFLFVLGVCFSLLKLESGALAAWPRHLSVCAGHLTSVMSRTTEQQTKDAIHSLRRFRFEALRQAGVDPSLHDLHVSEKLPDENYGSAGIVLQDEEKVAQQIRGIEVQARGQLAGIRSDFFDSETQRQTSNNKKPIKVYGVRLKGEAEIDEFMTDLRNLVGDVDNIGDYARVNELIHFMFGGLGLWVLGDFAIPQMVNMVQGHGVSSSFLPGVKGAFLLGPDAVARLAGTRDFNYERRMRHFDRNRSEPEWAYDSHSYKIHNGIVSSLLKGDPIPNEGVRATVNLDAQPFWNLWASEKLAKLKLKLESSTSLHGREDFIAFHKETRKVWVQIDRARFFEDGQPVVVMVVRTSEEQPQF